MFHPHLFMVIRANRNSGLKSTDNVQTATACTILGRVEANKSTTLLVVAPVISVAPNVTYPNTLCLAGLEDQLKSGAILSDLFAFVRLDRAGSLGYSTFG